MYVLRDAARAAKQSASSRAAPPADAALSRETAAYLQARERDYARERAAPQEPVADEPYHPLREAARQAGGQSYRPTVEPAAPQQEAYRPAHARSADKPFKLGPMPEIGVEEIVSWLLAGRRWIVLGLIAGILGGAGFGLLATPRYTVYTDMLIAPANLQVVQNDLYMPSLQSDSQVLEIESRMRVLTSGNVLRRVAAKLNLLQDEEFVGKPKWFDLKALFGGSTDDSADPVVPVLRGLSERITVTRQERSYLVTAAVWTWDPDKSVRVANALTEAFREELAQGDSTGASRAAQTLTDRLSELKTALSAAEDKVQAFRRQNNLQQSAAGQLVSTQSMAQINAKMLDAQGREIEAASRYRELTQARSAATNPSSALQSTTLSALRLQYAELKRQVDSMSLTYGPRHPALANTRSQLKAIETEISDESARILTTAKIELEQARSVVKGLEADNAKARTEVSQDDESQVQLRALERDAVAKAQLYQAFLTRAGEATQREQVDATNIRVVSTAVPPMRRSYPPRTLLTTAGGAAGGLALGCGIALMIGFAGAYRRNTANA